MLGGSVLGNSVLGNSVLGNSVLGNSVLGGSVGHGFIVPVGLGRARAGKVEPEVLTTGLRLPPHSQDHSG